MGKRDERTNTGEGGKGKRVRTTSDETGGKSVSEKSKSVGGKWWRRDSDFDEE